MSCGSDSTSAALVGLGCEVEFQHRTYAGVSVPPGPNPRAVQDDLARGFQEGLWNYEAPILRGE